MSVPEKSLTRRPGIVSPDAMHRRTAISASFIRFPRGTGVFTMTPTTTGTGAVWYTSGAGCGIETE